MYFVLQGTKEPKSLCCMFVHAEKMIIQDDVPRSKTHFCCPQGVGEEELPSLWLILWARGPT